MRARLILAAAASAVILAAFAAASAIAATAPAPQPVANDVYACVTGTGKVDYLEFRGQLPHACNPGDALWTWPSRILPPVSPPPAR